MNESSENKLPNFFVDNEKNQTTNPRQKMDTEFVFTAPISQRAQSILARPIPETAIELELLCIKPLNSNKDCYVYNESTENIFCVQFSHSEFHWPHIVKYCDFTGHAIAELCCPLSSNAMNKCRKLLDSRPPAIWSPYGYRLNGNVLSKDYALWFENCGISAFPTKTYSEYQWQEKRHPYAQLKDQSLILGAKTPPKTWNIIIGIPSNPEYANLSIENASKSDVCHLQSFAHGCWIRMKTSFYCYFHAHRKCVDITSLVPPHLLPLPSCHIVIISSHQVILHVRNGKTIEFHLLSLSKSKIAAGIEPTA